MALTHYETLGVSRDASRAEITVAFRAQMRALHGDAGGDDELAKHVSSAYNVLANASRRAIYDRTLAPQSPAAASDPSPASAPTAPRHRVFLPERGTRASSMLDVDPTAWDWYIPVHDRPSGAGAKSPCRRPLFTIFLVVAFVAWAAAGAAAAATLGLPLARIGAVSTPVALLCGVGAHLVWSALVITRSILRRWGLIAALLVTAAGAVCIYLDAGTPLPMLGSPLCLMASTLTTYLSFGVVLSRSSRDGDVIDSSFITQVGTTALCSRNADIERLLGALTGAFSHRDGVRVILLPDRVTPRPSTSPVRSQVAVVVGRSVHLIAIPPLGADGLEISGSEIINDGQVQRNVVHDEVQVLRRRYGRAADVYGYIVPTKLAAAPTEIEQVGGVSFGSLTQVLDAIGTSTGPSLDRPNALFRHRALESMTLLV
ncbi:J domain-containing protein [uncultured Brevibacterium sp.]|uniref:J domain-containing protein n=1 Tax=uncultured Brevibacterium sp. TaxID=189678 RepID=UPI0025F398F8|nr:J domain-containing protein [uncultured Brevibacterium sp.]